MNTFLRKVLTMLIVGIFFYGSATAQTEDGFSLKDSLKYKRCPTLYAGINIGANTPNGWAGASVMYPLVNHLSGRSGVGWGFWGYQISQEVIAYAGSCNSQAAIGVGLSYNIGQRNINHEQLITVSVNGQNGQTIREEYHFRTHPIWLGNVNVYYFFNNGKRKNRFFINGGIAIRLSEFKYDVSGPTNPQFGSPPTLAKSFVSGLSLGLGFFLNASKYPKRL